MLKQLFENSDWSTLSQFISPGFFSVMPVKESLGLATRLLKNSRDSEAWNSAKKQVQALLERRVHLVNTLDVGEQKPSLSFEAAQKILEIYFFEVLHSPVWILDYRAKSWSEATSGKLNWNPASFFYEPSEPFREAVRSLYIGFYWDNSQLFEQSMKVLGIQPAEAEIRAHFGLNDQRQIRFKLAEFQATFAKIFKACEKEKARIHYEFGVLGLMLLSLYDALEGIQAPLDVRSAFGSAYEFK